jgi:long-chain acyl-CoA synthetase
MGKELDTFPKLLIKNHQRYGSKNIPMRDKNFGIWNKYTWEDYLENVKYLCFALIKMGLKYGDKVSIIGENHPQWYWAELATQAAGGIVVGVFSDYSASEVKLLLKHSESKFVFAHDQEQVDKVLESVADLPSVTKVIYWETKGLWFYKEPILLEIDDVIKTGRKYEKEYANSFEEIIENGNGEDTAFILYSFGTAGLPEATKISYNSCISEAVKVTQMNPITEKDDYVPVIPLSWFAEQVLGVGCQLLTGMRVNFPEKQDTVRKDLREIAPQIIVYSNRAWEGIFSDIRTTMNAAKGLKKLIYRIFLSVGYRKEEYISEKREIPIFLVFLYFIGDCILFHGIKDEYGLTRARAAYSVGALISPDTRKFFSAIGVNVKCL